MAEAIRSFDEYHFPFSGFRAPYLKSHDRMSPILSQTGRFTYESSRPLLWDDIFGDRQKSFGFIEDFYKPCMHSTVASLPSIRGDLVDIPVSLPDDDILVDREGFPPERVSEIWEKMLAQCHQKGELFTLQLHPERIYELRTVLERLIDKAKSFDPPVWLTSLSGIARWTRQRNTDERWPAPYRAAFCVTGDIDCLAAVDFIDRLKQW